MAIIDADELTAGTRLESRVCIVGAGPVGISLSLRLAELGISSLLLESGGREPEDDTQGLAAGRMRTANTDLGPDLELSTMRVRMLGGSTNHWGGASRPFSEVDFEPNAWRGGHGWPILRSDALEFVDAAASFLRLDPARWGVSDWYADAPPVEDPNLEEQVFQVLPMPAGSAYHEDLERSERVELVLHTNATRVRLDESGTRVTELELKTLAGADLSAMAAVYVLAAGGVETPRLLLASRDDVSAGVGNSSGLVGRYFADHPALRPLPLVPGPRAAKPEAISVAPAFEVTKVLTLTEGAQRRLELPGAHLSFAEFGPPAVPDPEIAGGVEALANLGSPDPYELRWVVIAFETIPNAESRVTLSDERDPLGEPRAFVDWQLSDDDEGVMQRTIELFARHLARAGIGRLRAQPHRGSWREQVDVSSHHMGTMRMGTSASDSVVDTNLRLHDIENLYAAGSSVFPSFADVNPTLNAIALCYRLAEHLRREVTT